MEGGDEDRKLGHVDRGRAVHAGLENRVNSLGSFSSCRLTMLWIYRHQIWPRADSAQH